MRSLYVHFPFCESKCHYCDFYSLGRERTKEGDGSAYEKALRTECERASKWLSSGPLDTIFFGGGTPSMTPAPSMSQALSPLELSSRVGPETEWTMEANPSSISRESMTEYRALGINRVSMGVQSMREDLLSQLGRVHSREAALKALDAVFSAGFTNVSVDLLCGVPGQTESDLEDALSSLCAFPITHLSCYLLTLPKHHRMFKDLPSDEIQLSHLLYIDRWMTQNGFEHYEISNYAKPGKRARHNLNYWNGESYLGLGPSAHSYDSRKGERFKNVSSLHKYGELLLKGRSPVEWREELTAEQKELERWMLALRLSDGFPLTWLDTSDRRSKASLFQEKGLLEEHSTLDSRLRLTARGFALSDQVIAAFV